MSQTDRLSGEFALIGWIRRHLKGDRRVPIGPGDDTAALTLTPHREVLVTTDMILEGVHFDRRTATARQIGRKALAVNLSDIAAMAGVPVAAVVSMGIPIGTSRREVEELFHGMVELADEFDVAIVGGDTNRSCEGIVLCVTVIGEATTRGPVQRSGAVSGEWILCTGSFGGSIHGKHLEFAPRISEALALHERLRVHAMIDVSDGLAADLGHILEESRCGAELNSAAIPISEVVRRVPDNRSPLAHALYDGEDFELLFTLPESDARQLLASPFFSTPITAIGTIEKEAGLWLAEPDGSRRRIEPLGFDHFRQPVPDS